VTPGRNRTTQPASLYAVLTLAGALLAVLIIAVATAKAYHGPSRQVAEAINLAAATYGHAEELWRKARCETAGTWNPRSYNPSSGASGLFQFLPSTWQSTPYRRFSIWNPYASALAAGWMHAHGRGHEWACQ
jgi:hypothetical protein